MNLFGTATVDAPSDATLGMRPETVGAVLYLPLSVEARRSLLPQGNGPRRLQIALPGGKSVTCLVTSEQRPDGLVILSGVPEGDDIGRCDLVVENGQVTGDLDVAAARYRIVPVGPGATHAVVEIRTEAFPNEQEPRQPS
jgi:hypothetical protein